MVRVVLLAGGHDGRHGSSYSAGDGMIEHMPCRERLLYLEMVVLTGGRRVLGLWAIRGMVLPLQLGRMCAN